MEHSEPSMRRRDLWMTMLLDGAAEQRCRHRAAEYFGDMLRRIRVMDKFLLADIADDGVDAGKLDDDERQSLVLVDLVVNGLDRKTRQPMRLAVEVSDCITGQDVLRAVDRARLLEKLTGDPTMPAVAGYSIAPAYRQLAEDKGVEVNIVTPPDAGEPELDDEPEMTAVDVG